jgi:HEAT repeat protein
MILSIPLFLLAGAVAAAPLLRAGRRMDEAKADRAAALASMTLLPLLLAAAGWLMLRLYPSEHARLLAIVTALPTALLFLLLSRRKEPRWPIIAPTAAVLALVAVGGTEILLASAAAGAFPVRNPELCARIGGRRSLPALLRAAVAEDPEVRLQAVTQLGGFREPPVLPALQAALGDLNDQVREQAALALRKRGDPSSVPSLCAALHDRDKAVRNYAVQALQDLKDARAVPALLDAMVDRNGYGDGLLAKGAITNMGDLARPQLAGSLQDEDPLRRRAAVEVLGGGVDGRSAPPLRLALRDSDPRVRATAAESLANLVNSERSDEARALIDVKIGSFVTVDRDRTGVPANAHSVLAGLLPLTRDPSPVVRKAAVRGLAQIGKRLYVWGGSTLDARDPESGMRALDVGLAVPALLARLKDPEPALRREAVQALMECGDSRAVPALIGLLSSPDQPLVQYAAQALGLIGDQRAAPALAEADKRHTIGYCFTCEALHRLGRHELETRGHEFTAE